MVIKIMNIINKMHLLKRSTKRSATPRHIDYAPLNSYRPEHEIVEVNYITNDCQYVYLFLPNLIL